MIAPSAVPIPPKTARSRCPSSSSRYPQAALMLPNTSPTELETFAVTELKPTASSTGKVISDPEPTIALMPPAVKPAARTASACRRFTQRILPGFPRRHRDRAHRGFQG